MERHSPSPFNFTDLDLPTEFQDSEFRNQFFRTEREIDIPAQIKALRKMRRLRQAELAEKAGTQQSAISRLERAQEAKWELETLVRLAEALDARLSVVIEPYEEVIARYRLRESALEGSAATEDTSLRRRRRQAEKISGLGLIEQPEWGAAKDTEERGQIRQQQPSASELHGIGHN